jgi:predicted ATPase
MNIIVLTGGTLGGKTTIINNLKIKYKDKIIIIPEVACLLFEEEFRRPDVWSLEWHYSLQRGILKRQYELEEKAKNKARKNGVKLIVCDRGLLDPSAYLKDGLMELTREFGVNEREALSRYNQIIHLVSLSVLNPALYEKFVSTNPHRIESIEEARKQEASTIQAWKNHPNRVILAEEISASMKKIFEITEAYI